jgi:Fe2+ transport system protein FeoA
MATLVVENFGPTDESSVSSLADLPLGGEAHVVAVLEPGALGERLMELGLTAGTLVRVMRRGLFGDPVQLKLRGFMLSLRKRQAEAIRVRPLP